MMWKSSVWYRLEFCKSCKQKCCFVFQGLLPVLCGNTCEAWDSIRSARYENACKTTFLTNFHVCLYCITLCILNHCFTTCLIYMIMFDVFFFFFRKLTCLSNNIARHPFSSVFGGSLAIHERYTLASIIFFLLDGVSSLMLASVILYKQMRKW